MDKQDHNLNEAADGYIKDILFQLTGEEKAMLSALFSLAHGERGGLMLRSVALQCRLSLAKAKGLAIQLQRYRLALLQEDGENDASIRILITPLGKRALPFSKE